MRRAVKFFESKFEENVYEKGILSLGTFGLYRSMEEGDGIGDAFEASSILKAKGNRIDDHMPPQHKIWVETQLRLRVRDGGEIIFAENPTYTLADAYLYCISYGSPKSLCQPSDRDAAFVIKDKRRFYDALFNSNILTGHYSGKSLFEVSSKGGLGRVSYREIQRDVFGGESLGLSPFVKRPSYLAQSEFRFLFYALEGSEIFDSNMLIQIENLKDLIEKAALPLEGHLL